MTFLILPLEDGRERLMSKSKASLSPRDGYSASRRQWPIRIGVSPATFLDEEQHHAVGNKFAHKNDHHVIGAAGICVGTRRCCVWPGTGRQRRLGWFWVRQHAAPNQSSNRHHKSQCASNTEPQSLLGQYSSR